MYDRDSCNGLQIIGSKVRLIGSKPNLLILLDSYAFLDKYIPTIEKHCAHGSVRLYFV